VSAPVTIPLRASLAARSVEEILSFLYRVDQASSYPVTITLWSGAQDTVDLELLYQLVKEVGKDRVYVDVPFNYDPPAPRPSQLHSIIIDSINSALSALSLAV